MVSVEIASLVASVAGVLLIIATYFWSRMPRPDEIERILGRRLEGNYVTSEGQTIKFAVIRVQETDSILERLLKYLTLHPYGDTKVEAHIESPSGAETLKFDPEDFTELCNEWGVNAEYHQIGSNTKRNKIPVELEIDSTKTSEAYGFLAGLEEVTVEFE